MLSDNLEGSIECKSVGPKRCFDVVIPPYAVTFSWWGGGIEYLIDPDSYADWSFILLVGPPKSDRLKDRGQTK